nr:ABC transporter permease [Deinococcus peraridilitoris]
MLVWPALLLVALIPGVLPALLAPLNAGQLPLTDRPLWRLTVEHLQLVILAEFMVITLGVPLVVFVTRSGNRAFLSLAETLVGLGQTVPTLAILALAVPILGFGMAPTLLGLVLYGLVPVVSNGIVGLIGVNLAVLDAATGMGMTKGQRFWRVELPLALPVWLAGVRTSMVFNVAVATVGAALGAGGLGLPIILGLSQQDTALVFLGASVAALLALSLDALLGVLVAFTERHAR